MEQTVPGPESLGILLALPGLHRFDRGAEVAFMSLACELCKMGYHVTLAGSGPPREGSPYNYVRIPTVSRTKFSRFPTMPFFRNETAYEDFTFACGVLLWLRRSSFDLTLTCNYPFTNWALRLPAFGGKRPKHIFVTQNGDWPAYATGGEYRWFGCDGLVCTNPDYLKRNERRWRCALIANGVSIERYNHGTTLRARLGIPAGRKIVLMVSALIESKRVGAGVEAIAGMPDVHLIVAGDGPLRPSIDALCRNLAPGRVTILTLPRQEMPDLYRTADVVLHLSLEESFGNVFVEAMASGLPVVAHDSERIRWVIGDGGFLADTNSIENIRNSLFAALMAPKDLAGARKSRAAAFDWAAIARQYDSFFRSIAGRL